MNRTELRKKIMTILYQIFLYESNGIDYSVEEVIKESVKVENEFVNTIVNGVLECLNDIDKINDYVKNRESRETMTKKEFKK